jgi:hypothetical protein
MSQGIVTVDAAGLNMSFEGLADPARVWTCFEDFCGALEFLKIDGGSTDTAILGYSGVLCSSDGTAANQVALAAGGEAGGTVVMTPANTTACGITVPTALIDPDNGKRWFIETRLKIADLSTGSFKFGLAEDSGADEMLDADGIDGGATLDQIMVGFDTGTTTDGNLEYFISKDSTSGVHSGAGGMHADAQLVAGTYARIGIEGDGANGVRFYFDGNLVRATGADANGFVNAGSSMSDQVLTPMIAAFDDETVVEVDYLYIACER